MDVEAHYDKLAPEYDRAAGTMHWWGFPEDRIHRVAREALAVSPGEHVVVVGGGTGKDVVPLAQAAGSSGKIWNVDVSQGMLDVSRRRCEEADVDVEHVQTDAADWEWPACDAVLASFTLLFQPRYADVLRAAAEALGPDGRLVLCDLQMPRPLPRLAAPFLRRFGHTRQSLARRPGRLLESWRVEEDHRFYLGLGRWMLVRPPMP